MFTFFPLKRGNRHSKGFKGENQKTYTEGYGSFQEPDIDTYSIQIVHSETYDTYSIEQECWLTFHSVSFQRINGICFSLQKETVATFTVQSW